MELSEFLVEAKRHAYTGEDSVRKNYKILEDGFRECIFSKDDLVYRDRYFGSDPFAGEEVVFEDGRPIWMMNYYGKLIDGNISSEGIYDFLGGALAEAPEECTFRGPKFFAEGKFTYINHIEEKTERFKGAEFVLLEGQVVYELYYHGGSVK
jgi:hypothetical protein